MGYIKGEIEWGPVTVGPNSTGFSKFLKSKNQGCGSGLLLGSVYVAVT